MPQVKITRTNNGQQAPSGDVSSEEAAAIRSSVGGKEQAPTMQQLAGYVNWRQVADSLGDPFNTEHIPISKLRMMRRDPIIGFGLSFIKTPHVRARWYIDAKDANGPNAQIAAHLDHDLRRIMASIILQWSNSLDFGFQGIAKRFEFGIPSGTYVAQNPDGTLAEQPIWSEGQAIQPIRWKPFVALPPETVEPNWNPDGSFNGMNFDASEADGSIPGGTGATPAGGGEENKFDIDLYHCSPVDELVLTANRGYVQIGDLEESDRLVAWDKKQKRICRVEGYKFEKSVRKYSGDLIVVETDRFDTRVTPNHKFTVRWNENARDKWAIYLMRKGDWWRIGVTKLLKNNKNSSGIGQRVSNEGADAAWILGVADSYNEALYHEKLWSNKYSVPDMGFRSEKLSENCLTTDQLEIIWESVDSQTGALKLLKENDLEIDHPFYTIARDDSKMAPRGLRGWTCVAANLISDIMEVPVDPGGGHKADWEPITVDRTYYNGDVVSIDIPPHHHYVSNGIITQNSLWVTNERDQNFGSIYGYPRLGYAYQYWWSYWFRWSITDRAFEKKADPTIIIKHPQGEFVDPSSGQQMAYSDYALNMGYRMRSGGVMTIPSTPYEGANGPISLPEWDVDFTKDMVNFDPFDKSFDYLDIGKMRALWIPEQSLVEGKGGTSSRNVAAQLDSSFTESQAVMSVQIGETVNRWIIPQWLAVNYPEFIQNNGTAQIVIQGFADEDVAFTQQILQLIGQQVQGINKLLTMVDLTKILDDAGVPLLDLKAQQLETQRQVTMAQAGAAGTPNPVPPRGGKNGNVGVVPAGSTGALPVPDSTGDDGGTDVGGTTGDGSDSQTGFTYIQPREVIYLSAKDVYDDDELAEHEERKRLRRITVKRVPDSDDGVIARFDPDQNTVFLADSASVEDSQKYLAAIGQALV